MKQINYSLFIFIFLFIAFCSYRSCKGNQFRNDFICETYHKELKDVIIKMEGKANNEYIILSRNNEKIFFPIKKIIKKNINKSHLYSIGDSVIKKRESNLVYIKDQFGESIYLMGCELE